MKKFYYQDIEPNPNEFPQAADGLSGEIKAAYQRTNTYVRKENEKEMSKNMRTVKMQKLT